MKNFTITFTGIERNFEVTQTAVSRNFEIRQGVGPVGPAGATGPAGPAGPNSVTSATTSDGTCDLWIDTLRVGTSTASGIRSAALGQSTASGDLSFAQGLSTASNDYAFASGDGSTASGYGSFAINNSTASGDLSFATGGGTTASGDYSLAFGFSSVAMEIHSAAIGRRAKSIHEGASVESDSQDADVESAATNEKTFRFANGYRFLGGTASFTAVVAPSEVKSANFTAANGGSYVTVNNATVTDPTPSEGAAFRVLVRNGIATVGGTAYAIAGSLIRRVFHSGSWQNYEYKNHAQYGNLATVNGGTGVATALAVNTGSAGAIVVNGGTATDMTYAGSAAFTSTTRPTSAGTGTPAATSLITRNDFDSRIVTGLMNMWSWPVQGTTFTNNGGVGDLNGGASLFCGANNVSTLARFTGASQPPYASIGTASQINFSNPISFSFLANSSAIAASGTNRIYLGMPHNISAIQDIATKGFGIKVTGSQIFFQVFGTSLVTSSTAVGTLSSLMQSFTITGDGSGTYNLFINSVLVSTLSGGPTGQSTDGSNRAIIAMCSTTDTSPHRFLINAVKLWL